MSTTRVDSLRSTLDHLALDARAQEDKPYLVSMLRRLGYSDVEIRTALGSLPEEAPAPEPAPAPAPVRRVDSRPRVVEVEYTGPDYSQEYQRVGPGGVPAPAAGGKTRFSLGGGEAATEGEVGEDGEMSFALAEETYEGSGEDFGDFDISAVDSAEGNWDDDWGEGGDFGSAIDKKAEGDTPGLTEAERKKILEDLGLDPEDESIVEFGPRRRPDYNLPAEAPSRLIEFSEFHPQLAPSRLATPEDATAIESEEGWTPGDAGAWEGEAEEESTEPYMYKEYVLYKRDVELSTGKRQTIYFFAKNPPKNGDPCPLPKGYEVGENEKTGLPYLRRVYEDEPEETTWEEPEAEPAPAPRKKRVRAVRVTAASAEEAQEMIRNQGKDVRGAMPIDYEEGED
jgi:hypothetical protein